MIPFFDGVQSLTTVTHGHATFDLPIRYYRDDAFALYFTASYEKVRAAMPSRRLHPVMLPGGKAVVAIAAFNYIDTSIGPYGEVAVAMAAVYGRRTTSSTGWLPALMESAYPGFGLVVMHLPVTRVEARDAGRGQWGYTKFMADMAFHVCPEHYTCRLAEGDRQILEMRVARRGICLRDRKPLVTYSVKDGSLIKTIIPQTAIKRVSLGTGRSRLTMGDHPVAASVRRLGIASRPLMSVTWPERAAILPAGTVIEKGVDPMVGYRGKDRRVEHRVSYPG